MRWSEISRDPNSAEALGHRAEQVRAARRPPVDDRAGYLCELARDRNVLDIGFVDHDISFTDGPSWLHARLVAVASRCVGIDVVSDAVEMVAARGYDVRSCDVTRDRLDETFDLIVAGEVLEHLGDPEAMFRNVGEMLGDRGRFVFSTPNPFALHRVWRGTRGDARDSVDHVAYFAPGNIVELGARTGLALESFRGVRLKRIRTPRGRLQAAARALLARTVMTEEIACETIVYECVRAADGATSP
ncbi:MAG: class I SAM-dependent methyltransferase [Actinomycetota bacterium]